MKGLGAVAIIVVAIILSVALLQSGVEFLNNGGDSVIGIMLFFGIPFVLIYGFGKSIHSAYDDEKKGIIRTYHDVSAWRKIGKERAAIYSKYKTPFEEGTEDYDNCEKELAEFEKRIRMGPPGSNW